MPPSPLPRTDRWNTFVQGPSSARYPRAAFPGSSSERSNSVSCIPAGSHTRRRTNFAEEPAGGNAPKAGPGAGPEAGPEIGSEAGPKAGPEVAPVTDGTATADDADRSANDARPTVEDPARGPDRRRDDHGRDRAVRETGQDGQLQGVVYGYLEALVVQISLSAACNAVHQLNQRCARWLLQTHDRVDSNTFGLTQEYLGVMLGVQRPSVSIAQRTLQEAGCITFPPWLDHGHRQGSPGGRRVPLLRDDPDRVLEARPTPYPAVAALR